MTELHHVGESAISWERARGIFGNPPMPRQVWERQLDGFDDVLERLARTPYGQIDFADMWYYHHDLAYVELQPDLFAHLFPVCLMDWHDSLRRNESCSHGDSEFHYGIRQGKVLEKMVTPEQREAIFGFFRDSFLERLDAERGFIYAGSRTPAYGWMGRFNSLGIVMPGIDRLWERWWSLDTPGRSVAAVQYCSGLMCAEGDNPLFPGWTPEDGGGGPYLWGSDSHVHDAGWAEDNLAFLRTALTVEFVNDRVAAAVSRLRGEPEWEKARRLLDDLPNTQELLTLRTAELPLLLNDGSGTHGWSV